MITKSGKRRQAKEKKNYLYSPLGKEIDENCTNKKEEEECVVSGSSKKNNGGIIPHREHKNSSARVSTISITSVGAKLDSQG